MKAFNYLKHSITIYLTTGLMMGVSLFAAILIARYNSHRFQDLYDIKKISISEGKIKRQLQEIHDLKDVVQRRMHIDLQNVHSARNIFLALDDIKATLPDAVITVEDIQEKNGRRELPLSLVVPVRKYSMIIDCLSYLEAFRIPDYEISHVLVSKEESGAVSLSIKGTLVMPVSEVREEERNEQYG